MRNPLRRLITIFRDEEEKKLFQAKYFNLNRYLSVKKLFLYASVFYVGGAYFVLTANNKDYRLKASKARLVSRLTGKFAQLTVPESLRKPLYGFYSNIYNVNYDEIVEPIESFESFSKFFTRAIKPRPVDPNPLSIASPADSRVLTFSEVTGDEVLIVKGIEYKLGEFLTGVESYKIRGEILNTIKRNPENKLYQIVLYLAPGDYHRYHSPTDYLVKSRVHIYGDLQPVKEQYVKTHTGVYERNERVSVFGDWNKGFMSMVFVGALNVGSIDLNFDKALRTNKPLPWPPFKWNYVKLYTKDPSDAEETDVDKTLMMKPVSNGIPIKKGEEIGKFNLGSTIALIFEASSDFEWKVQPGEAVKYGQPIGLSK